MFTTAISNEDNTLICIGITLDIITFRHPRCTYRKFVRLDNKGCLCRHSLTVPVVYGYNRRMRPYRETVLRPNGITRICTTRRKSYSVRLVQFKLFYIINGHRFYPDRFTETMERNRFCIGHRIFLEDCIKILQSYFKRFGNLHKHCRNSNGISWHGKGACVT